MKLQVNSFLWAVNAKIIKNLIITFYLFVKIIKNTFFYYCWKCCSCTRTHLHRLLQTLKMSFCVFLVYLTFCMKSTKNCYTSSFNRPFCGKWVGFSVRTIFCLFKRLSDVNNDFHLEKNCLITTNYYDKTLKLLIFVCMFRTDFSHWQQNLVCSNYATQDTRMQIFN